MATKKEKCPNCGASLKFKVGRPHTDLSLYPFARNIVKMKKAGKTYHQIRDALGVSVGMAHRVVKAFEAGYPPVGEKK